MTDEPGKSPTEERLKTWGGNKSVRLRGFDYSEHVPYHVIIRARPTTSPFLIVTVAETVCSTLIEVFRSTDAYLACYCLMPDHLHLLFSPDRSGLTVGQIVARFKGLSTRRAWS